MKEHDMASKNKSFISRIGSKLRKGDANKKTSSDNVDALTIDSELQQVKKDFAGFDKDHVWCFIAGQASQDFRGNPKYLFVYVCKYRPDICAYWLCENEETLEQVRSLGFTALKTSTPAAQYAINRTGVIAAEQVKFAMPDGFEDVKYLNLWHGVGFKNVERTLYQGDIAMDLARKYVMRGTYYRDRELVAVTCPTIEHEYYNDLGVDPDHFIHAGYVRCEYQNNFEPIATYEHDLRKVKGLSEDAKMVVYAPTYRASLGGTFAKAITDIERLYSFCEENNILFIFKMHPNMESEIGFLNARDTYGDRKNFWFWDNQDDFYEIMDQMDLAIVDYSGIISDMVAMGVPHYIRYVYDLEEYMSTVNIHDNYYEKTTGILCHDFDELIDAMRTFEERDESEEIKRLMDVLWTYAGGKEDFDKIIQATLDFKVEKREHPNLYSFDIFDTLISRKVLDPMGVFYGVQERMRLNGGFPYSLTENYPAVRHSSEFSEREYYLKSQGIRDSDHTEVTLVDIFGRMQSVYGLTDEQVDLLVKWELEIELDNTIPLPEQIDIVRRLHARGETVILVSDMYLPKEHIKAMLEKADPLLAELPLFLSNEYGVLKTSQKLYFEVYKSFEPYYDFKEWIHYGDNKKADVSQARKFKINTRQVNKPEFNEYQETLVEGIQNYDAYLVAAAQARMCFENHCKWDDFVISFVSMCMVPYVDWALRDAERRGYETLYFVSRDGHHLKRIADAIIEKRGLHFKTKLIYASRRVWRIPSYIDEIDIGFWEGYGNFGKVASAGKLLSALHMDEEKFHEIFPSISLDEIDFLDTKAFKSYVEIFKNSDAYNEYLLGVAAEERVIVNEYLLQEIDPNERFAIVEYYGRGYNQECMIRLWREAIGDPQADIPYYYARSILHSMEGCTRYNFTTNNAKQYFIEAIFANMPYKSIEEYEYRDGRVEPVIKPITYNRGLYESMNRLLPVFASRFAGLELNRPEDMDRLLFDYVFDFFEENKENPRFAEKIGVLVDSTLAYGDKREFAPKLTFDNLNDFRNKVMKRGSWYLTSSLTMSVTRSDPEIVDAYKKMYQIMPGDAPLSGRLLSEKREGHNQNWKHMYEELREQTEKWKASYDAAVPKTTVGNTVLFVTKDKAVKTAGSVQTLEEIEKTGIFDVKTISLANIQDRTIEECSRELAGARYILMDKPVDLLSTIVFRDETKLILLSNTPFSLYRRGLQQTFDLSWHQKLADEFGADDFDVLQVPSERQKQRFLKNFTVTGDTECGLGGSCATDIYYQGRESEFKKKLANLFPESKNKKVILYMPKLRRRNSTPQWANLLDLEVLSKLVGDEYVVVFNYVKSSAKGFINLEDVPGFSKTILEKEMPLRELMIASDIIVGDYRATFFEGALLRKPIFCTIHDYEKILTDSNVDLSDICDFEDLIMGPVVVSANELAAALEQVNDFDYSKAEKVKNLLFSDCDGKSAKRVASYLASDYESGITR